MLDAVLYMQWTLPYLDTSPFALITAIAGLCMGPSGRHVSMQVEDGLMEGQKRCGGESAVTCPPSRPHPVPRHASLFLFRFCFFISSSVCDGDVDIAVDRDILQFPGQLKVYLY